jgi:hypothetical protein
MIYLVIFFTAVFIFGFIFLWISNNHKRWKFLRFRKRISKNSDNTGATRWD